MGAAIGGRLRKFNPGTLQTDAEVMSQFVVRLRELEIVLEVLRANIESESCQHLLMVAPRGRGKTMLLARTAAELRKSDALGRCLLPVRFMEENHEIFGMADFWLESLFHVARETAGSHPELSGELRVTHADFCGRWGERDLGLHARAAVLEAADRLDRKLVLMVENLQALCANVDEDFGWQLRAALQSEPQVMLVATATSRFGGLDDAEEPFFELFRSVELKPLSIEECRRLWEAVSGDRRVARNIRPLEILTGGNPRLLSIVAGFSEHRSLGHLMQELVSLIDDHTEYFRGHLEVLPKGERRVYVAVLDLWRASKTGEIAARARMGVRTVSTLLGRLVERGAVVTRPAGSGKKLLYTAAEPLYSIYYKLRRERNEAAVVENLIQFMVAFYDRFFLYGIFDRLWSEVKDSPSLHAGIERALAQRPVDDGDLGTRMLWDSLARESEKIRNSRRANAEMAFQKEMEAAFQEGKYARVIELVDGFLAEGWQRQSDTFQDHDEAYFAHLRADAYLGMGEYRKVIDIGNGIIDRFRSTRNVSIFYRSVRVSFSKTAAHLKLGEYRKVIACANQLVDWIGDRTDSVMQEIVAKTLHLAAEAEERLDNSERAVVLLEQIVQRSAACESPAVQVSVAKALEAKATNIRVYGEDPQTALGIYDELIDRYGESDDREIGSCVVNALMNRAFAQGALGHFEGELGSYAEVIRRCSEQGAWDIGSAAGLACALQALRLAEIGRSEEARSACGDIEQRLGRLSDDWEFLLGWMAKAARAIAYEVDGEDAAAIAMFRSALPLCPAGNEVTMRAMVRVVSNLIAVGAKESDLLEVMNGEPAKARAFSPLVVALRMRTGGAVRAPGEILEVATDISKRIESESLKGVLCDF